MAYVGTPIIVGVLTIVALSGLSASVRAAGAVPIDSRVELKIGDWTVTGYRLQKNLLRQAWAQNSQVAGDDLKLAWYQNFLAQQVLIADAFALGYGLRSEVDHEVTRMERHMLTDEKGPYYDSLALSPSSLSKAPDATFPTIYTGQVWHFFPDSSKPDINVQQILSLPASEQEKRLQNHRTTYPCDYIDGNIGWPYFEVADIFDKLAAASHGKLTAATGTDGTIYFLRLRVSADSSNAELTYPPPAVIDYVDRHRFALRRKAQILRDVQFHFDWNAASELLHENKGLRDLSGFPLSRINPQGILATYGEGSDTKTVTDANLVDYFNTLYVKQKLTSELDLRSLVSDFVVNQIDYAEALRSSLPQEEQFLEDKINYRAYSALILYEKERVRPELGVTEEFVKEYYRQHLGEFQQITAVEGRLLSFATMGSAKQFLQSFQKHEIPSATPFKTEPIVLHRDSILTGLEQLPKVACDTTGSQMLGPWRVGNEDQSVLWTFDHVTERDVQPLAAVHDGLRTRLENIRLSAFEMQRARQLAKRYSIDDHIDTSALGITGLIQKPWSL